MRLTPAGTCHSISSPYSNCRMQLCRGSNFGLRCLSNIRSKMHSRQEPALENVLASYDVPGDLLKFDTLRQLPPNRNAARTAPQDICFCIRQQAGSTFRRPAAIGRGHQLPPGKTKELPDGDGDGDDDEGWRGNYFRRRIHDNSVSNPHSRSSRDFRQRT